MRLRGLERRLSYFFKPFLVEDPPVLFAVFFTDFLEALLVVFLSTFFAVLAFGFLADFPAVFFLVFLAAFFFGFLDTVNSPSRWLCPHHSRYPKKIISNTEY